MTCEHKNIATEKTFQMNEGKIETVDFCLDCGKRFTDKEFYDRISDERYVSLIQDRIDDLNQLLRIANKYKQLSVEISKSSCTTTFEDAATLNLYRAEITKHFS